MVLDVAATGKAPQRPRTVHVETAAEAFDVLRKLGDEP
jgi:hypothetical protein